MKELPKAELKGLLIRWAEEYRVLAPGLKANGDCLFDDFDEESFTLDYGKPPLPPKSVCFPQSEITFTVDKGRYSPTVKAGPTILFGIRACDLMGLRQSSNFMNRDRRDPYYGAKRDAALTVVMACPGPQNDNCFCTTMNSGPAASRGFDLQLYDFGESFIVEIGSPEGEEFLSPFSLPDLEPRTAAERTSEFRSKASRAMRRADAVPEAMDRLKNGTENEGVWDRFGDKCIQCGACAYVCPTCTCFDVSDHVSAPGSGIRVRSWDVCLLGGFTREASGHNPRPTQALRLKRRHEHKMLYYNGDDIQEAISGCTGCGRCSDFCPVHIGTLEVAAALAGRDSPGK